MVLINSELIYTSQEAHQQPYMPSCKHRWLHTFAALAPNTRVISERAVARADVRLAAVISGFQEARAVMTSFSQYPLIGQRQSSGKQVCELQVDSVVADRCEHTHSQPEQKFIWP
jgi:hypothetical protein